MSESNFAVTIEEQTVVNGKVITSRTTDDELYAIINQAEAEIAKLGKMKAQPKSLKARIKALEEGVVAIVGICDARSDEAAD